MKLTLEQKLAALELFRQQRGVNANPEGEPYTWDVCCSIVGLLSDCQEISKTIDKKTIDTDTE